MSYLKRQFFAIILFISPIHNALAYTDRTLISYFTDNIIVHMLFSGGYITLAIFLVSIILSFIFKTFRTMLVSLLMAFFALYMLILIYEVIEEMTWVPQMY
mgnify:FL=1